MKIVDFTDQNILKERMTQPMRHSHFCAGVVVEGSKVLVVRYLPYRNSQDNIQIKFIGGTSQEGDETPLDVLSREMKEELFKDNSGKILSYRPFLERECVDDKNRPPHSKIFSLIEVDGKFRDKTLFEDKKTDDIGRMFEEEVGIPEFVEVRYLTKGKNKIFFRHKRALLELCKILAPENEEFMWANLDLERLSRVS